MLPLPNDNEKKKRTEKNFLFKPIEWGNIFRVYRWPALHRTRERYNCPWLDHYHRLPCGSLRCTDPFPRFGCRDYRSRSICTRRARVHCREKSKPRMTDHTLVFEHDRDLSGQYRVAEGYLPRPSRRNRNKDHRSTSVPTGNGSLRVHNTPSTVHNSHHCRNNSWR